MNIKIKLVIGSLFALALNISSAQTTNLNPLHNELAASHDYKKFFDKVKGQVKSGGLFYATLVVQRCMKVQDITSRSLDNDDGNLARRKEAIGKLKSLCSGFKKSELTNEKLVSIYQSPSANQDPFMVPLQKLIADMSDDTNKVSLEDHRLIIQNMIAENSPEALMEIMPFIPFANKGYYFDGKYYQEVPAHDGLIFGSAMLLTSCDLGDKCDVNDFRLLVACVDKEICVDSRFEYVQAVFQRFSDMKSPDDVGSVVSLSNKLTRAIKNHDVNLFIPNSTQ